MIPMAPTSDTLASDGASPTDAPAADPSSDGAVTFDATGAGTTPTGRGYEPMSVRGPALIVLGLAVVLLLGGVVGSALTSGSSPTFTVRHVTLADGTTVAVAPAAGKLHAIVSNSEPPADILGNLGVLAGSSVTGVTSSDQGAAQFDRTAQLTSGLSQTQVLDGYTKLLRKLGWQVIYSGPAPQGTPGSSEVLAKRGSGDGFYWEVGVVVSPTTSAGITPFSLRLFEQSDEN